MYTITVNRSTIKYFKIMFFVKFIFKNFFKFIIILLNSFSDGNLPDPIDQIGSYAISIFLKSYFLSKAFLI